MSRAHPAVILRLACLVLGLLVARPLDASAQPPDARAADRQQIEYAASDADFPNPDRGFYEQYTVLDLGEVYRPLPVERLIRHRADGISLVRVYFVIDEFREAPLSPKAIDAIDAAFATVRAAGLRIIPRFAYSYPCITPSLPCSEETIAREARDPSLERVLQHIAQLGVVLRAQADVIAFMEVGFVGAWGEWHHSSSKLVNRDGTVNKRSRAIVMRLLSVLDERRMAALRYPYQKQALFGVLPLAEDEAFTGTPRARIGAHNDCFVSSPEDTGTYAAPGQGPSAKNIKALRKFLSFDNRFLPQGGETCANDARALPYTGCSNAVAELRRLRWSTIHVDYFPGVLQRWREEDCFDGIARHLGYRFRLVSADLPTTVAAGDRLRADLRVANDGWASPFNPHDIELVLRDAAGTVTALPLDVDPRRWSAGEEHTLEIDARIPAALAAGPYELLLNLPDPDARLRPRPEYSIRFANDQTWESSTGFNALKATLTIEAPR